MFNPQSKEGYKKETTTEKSRSAAPAIAVPKGGGAIRGIGETFAANPVTGTASLSIPIFTTSGRTNFAPQLSLAYDSGSGNGPFGFGWSLSIPAITRKTEKGLPRYQDAEDSDVFMLSGAEDLVPMLVEDKDQWRRDRFDRTLADGTTFTIHRYRPRIEGPFARIERWTNKATGETHWRSISRENISTLYGKRDDARIADPSDSSRIFSWLICESYDDKGNAIFYEYKPEDASNVDQSLPQEKNRLAAGAGFANRYLKRIVYGNRTPRKDGEELALRTDWLFEVVFDYGEHDAATLAPHEVQSWPCRQDAFSSSRAGFEVRTYRLCRRVLMFHEFAELGNTPCLVRSTDFIYTESPIASFVNAITQSGYVRDNTTGTYLKKSLPPLEFTYTQPQLDETIHEIDADSIENVPMGLDGARYQWVDLDGEGLAGILAEQAEAWFYKPNDGDGHFGPVQLVATKPSIAELNGGRQQLLDLAGDGQLDLVQFGRPLPGYYERTAESGWESFIPFASAPNVAWHDPNLKFVDLTGDGHADILISEDGVFAWYPSLAEDGFGPGEMVRQATDEERGPKLVFADGTQSVYLADMSGDGLTDLVRIRNGEVCYWPNLGYGRFGAKVTMGDAPWFDAPDQFDQRRIRMADIDGSGVTDIIYLGRDGAHLYFNQSGNSWSDVRTLTSFPRIDNLSSVTVVDLLGNGTACLVWSSPLPGAAGRPMRYIDLMGGQKPHLLVSIKNNLGAETRVQYAASTRFYLDDRANGRPWITRLPFPVHVVERVETFDAITRTKFVNRYAYHHGYYDGVEREFRGFGMVEQLDTEEFASFAGAGLFAETLETAGEAFHLPPVHTKTWFHHGAYITQGTVSRLFEGEYYQGDSQATLLPDTQLPEGLTAEEEREACRALKGRILRQEVYADDDSTRAADPYSVTEFAYRLRLLQPKRDDHDAVFYTYESEALSYHYERNAADPRLSHALTLEVDSFGNVTRSAAVGYGRRMADSALSAQEQGKQTRPLMTYTEHRIANRPDEADWYRIGVPIETRTYELTGAVPESGIFTVDALAAAAQAAREIPYEQAATARETQKRPIEHVRSLYRKDDLSGPLPLGQVESLALPFESYKLAFTPGLAKQLYDARVNDAMLAGEASYVHTEGDANWWIPSGRSVYAANARDHFYLPAGFTDPFGNTTTIRYDRHDMLLEQTADPLGNTVVAENDYRVMQPRLVTDPNGNRSAVAFDVLGMVVGTAVMGKAGENKGDTLAGFNPDLDEATIIAHIQNPLADPHTILQKATTRLVYDLGQFQRTAATAPKPNVVYILARETHDADLAPGQLTKIQHSFSHSDGLGREVMKKIQAEPGPAPARDANGTLRCNNNLQPADPRWVGTGRTVFDNKGNPVKKYEPFFSPTHTYEDEKDLVECGVTPIFRYDPLGRLIRTDHPNGTFIRVDFDPWRHTTFDENDTVQDSRWYAERGHPDPDGAEPSDPEQRAAYLAARHANTPTVAHLDTLGRVFLTIADNGSAGKYRTTVELDIEGNQRAVVDALGRTAMTYDYDMLGSRIRQVSVDAGTRWALSDVAGKPIRGWDSRDHATRTTYDKLRRPTQLFVREGNAAEKLVERTVYGEDNPDSGGAHPEQAPRKLNLRGRVYQHYDGAGVATNQEYDFKGNLLRSSRQLAHEYKQRLDWSANVALEDRTFTSSTSYDALNRPVALTAPDNSVVRPAYNEANLLEKVDVNLHGVQSKGAPAWTTFVKDVDYNARGQRTLIRYGNDVQTDYTYDRETFRLTNLKTARPSTFSADNRIVQDLSYTYDPVGNLTAIRDDAQQPIYFKNQAVTASSHYMYDAIYRLTSADGREHLVKQSPPQPTFTDAPRMNEPNPSNGRDMHRYVEQYSYDAVGNLLGIAHTAKDGSWTRAYAYDEPNPKPTNNRLTSTTVGSSTERYGYDAHGNMISMPHLRQMAWDFQDQLQMVDMGGGGKAYFVYDSGGQRARKVVERQNGTRQEERLYLGGFEIFRSYDGKGVTLKLERETLHVVDGARRIALIETRTAGKDDSPAQLIRLQIDNHLGSAATELDDAGKVISYEEYYPYGSTSYQALDKAIKAAAKRYRYTGKERDEESGLYYHGARYYAPWLGRWTSPDPIGLADGPNQYVYTHCNPMVNIDPIGTQTSRADNELFRDLLISQQIWGDRPEKFVSVLEKNEEKYQPILAKFGYRGVAEWEGSTVPDLVASAQRNFNRAAQAWYRAGGSQYLNTEVAGTDASGNPYQGRPLRNAVEALRRSVEQGQTVYRAIAGANLGLGAIGYGLFDDKGAIAGNAIGEIFGIAGQGLQLRSYFQSLSAQAHGPSTTIEQEYFRWHQTSKAPSPQQLRGNTRAGFINEELRTWELRRAGYSILGTQVPALSLNGETYRIMRDPERFIDAVVVSPDFRLEAYEFKLGNSRYKPRQRTFDQNMESQGAHLGLFGEPLRMPTVLHRTPRRPRHYPE